MKNPKSKARARIASALLLALALAGCDSDGSRSGGGGGDDSSSMGGSGVKGPLANAEVNAYAFDGAAQNFQGTLLDSGETTAGAAISGIVIPGSHSGAVILEIAADGDTTDLTTGAAPVITRLLTVVAAGNLGQPVYPSPLTTIAFRLAGANGDSTASPYSGDGDGTLSEAEFLSAFGVAARQTASTLGFGLESGADLNTTPPLITDETDTLEEQAAAARYRTAIEAVSAVVENMKQTSQGNNPDSTVQNDDLLAGLADDLSDGAIDGQAGGEAIAAFADVDDVAAEVTVDPATLKIPGTEISVTDVEDEMVREKEDTGSETDTTALEDGSASADPEPATTEPDSDDDSVNDSQDNCPLEANADQANFDGDDKGDVCDDDDDNDGVADSDDAFPLDASETEDTDGDGIGNNADTDDDGDGTSDEEDAFPLDESEDTDTDGDGIGNNADTDDDGDGVGDEEDAFPTDPNETTDTDSDGTGDNADQDADGDGVEDEFDNCPLTDNPDQADSDGDGVGDACDSDNPGPQAAVWDEFNWDQADWQ